MRKLIAILFLWVLPFYLAGQEDRVTESEVQEEARFLEALQFRILEKWDDALEAFLEISRTDPDNDVVHFEIAKIYYKKGDDQSARLFAEKAVEINPGQFIYREFLIDLLSGMRDFESLNQQLNFFIKSQRFNEEHYYQLARSYENAGSYGDAIGILDQLEDRIGYSIRLGKARVRIYQKEDRKRKLRKELDRLTDEFPAQLEVLLHKAVLLDSMNEQEAALEAYREILEIDPENVAANMYLTNRIRENQTESQFFNALEALIENKEIPLDEKIKQLIPYVPRLNQDQTLLDDLLRIVHKLDEMYPDEAKVNALHGDLYFNAGKPGKAIPYYERTLELNKGVFLVWKQLMMAQDHELNFEALRKTAEEAVDYFPNQSVFYYYAGKANIETGLTKKGLDWLEEGIWMTADQSKLKSEYHLLFAYAYLISDQLNLAESHFAGADMDKLGRNHAFYTEVSGDLLFKKGQVKEAVRQWELSREYGGRADRLTMKIDKANSK